MLCKIKGISKLKFRLERKRFMNTDLIGRLLILNGIKYIIEGVHNENSDLIYLKSIDMNEIFIFEANYIRDELIRENKRMLSQFTSSRLKMT